MVEEKRSDKDDQIKWAISSTYPLSAKNLAHQVYLIPSANHRAVSFPLLIICAHFFRIYPA